MNKVEELEALFDAVIVKPFEEEEETYGNIVVADLNKEGSKKGIVVTVGPGKYSVTGDNFISTILKPGDKVILPGMGFTRFTHQRDEYWIGNENLLLARIK